MDTIAPGMELDLYGAASDRGGWHHGARYAAAALAEHGMVDWLAERGVSATWRDTVGSGLAPEQGTALDAVARLCNRLATRVEHSVAHGRKFVVFGGDHSCAIGTWSGAHNGLPLDARLGLIWFDAHMDAHTPATTPSGRLHGMPLACLMGHGPEELTRIARRGPALLPHNLCLIGVRSYEEGERALLSRLGVRVIMMDEVRRRGLSAVTKEALAIARRDTGGIGISVDLDVLDPNEAPGVGSRVAGGLEGMELAQALKLVHGAPDLLGIELAEYNPLLDRTFKTEDQLRHLLAAALTNGAR
jgi:arginase